MNLHLTPEQESFLAGAEGRSTQKAMQILLALGRIYGARRMVAVSSVQIAGVSYDNLGEAGLQYLAEMADGGGRARVLTTLNPAGMDVDNWQALGISPEFAAQQQRVLQAFARMAVITTCTCTPYLSGNLPLFGQHIAWAESSAVCYANSVIGARTNREGGPSALAAALTGCTPEYGYHLDENRVPGLAVQVDAPVSGSHAFGALGRVIGEKIETLGGANLAARIPFISGISRATLEELKSFCASLATYGGAALFHMEGITPEAARYAPPAQTLSVTAEDLQAAAAAMSDAQPGDVDFVSLGCPHLSIEEIARLAELLAGKQVRKEFWITTSRPVKGIADRMGFTQVIEASGARFAVDTCCVVAPIRGRFQALATDSAKACYYAAAKNRFKTLYTSFEEAVEEALR